METASFDLREIKLAGDGEAMTFSGYGAVFGNVDSYGDVIQPGAFAESLAAYKQKGTLPAMLMQHGGMGLSADDMTPIGIWTDMAEDGTGLRVTGKLAPTPRGQEAYALLKMDPRPAITGLSIGYVAKAYEPRSKPEDPRRKLTKIDLYEVSLVTFPANPQALVGDVKSLTKRELEEMLTRGAGLSRSQARALMRDGINGLTAKQDAGKEDLEQLARTLRDILRNLKS